MAALVQVGQASACQSGQSPDGRASLACQAEACPPHAPQHLEMAELPIRAKPGQLDLPYAFITRFMRSMASSISAGLLKPMVTASTEPRFMTNFKSPAE